jgi:superfamily I DNA and/or RNA helicase
VHEANDNASKEEADLVSQIARAAMGGRWLDAERREQTIDSTGVLVVTPYNAQITEIGLAFESLGVGNVRVGTVDKFQGQEAPIVIYSTATSTAEDAPRGMEFLYDLHRLNVATSRARCLVVVVTNPELVRVFCRTPRQMQLANALCRLRELAI